MRVRLTAEAESDLEGIADYIARDNLPRALAFIQDLRGKCLGLAEMPLAFPILVRYEQSGIRRRVHGSYQIFYRVDDQQVIVLHILHGAMDYAAILFES